MYDKIASLSPPPARGKIKKQGEHDTMKRQPNESTESERLLRSERTEFEGITVDYLFTRNRRGEYSLRITSGTGSETLAAYTDNPLLAEAFYLLTKEEHLLPGTLAELWGDCQPRKECPTR